MQARPSPPIHPIEFITFINASRIGNSVDRDDGNAIGSLICDNDSKYDVDFNDACSDPTFDVTSLDEVSAPPWPLTGANSLDDNKIFNTPSQPSLSRTYNSDSSDIIDMISYNGPSSRSDTIAKNTPSSEYLCHTLYPEYIKSSVTLITFANEYEYRNSRNRPSIVSCESTAATSVTTSNIYSLVSQHSLYSTNRVQEIKARLRSSELRYYQKRTSSKRSMVQSTTSTNASCDHNDNDTPVCNRLSSSHYYRLVSTMQSMLEAAGKIICFNTSLYMVYLLFVFYKYSLSIAIQGFQQFGFAL